MELREIVARALFRENCEGWADADDLHEGKPAWHIELAAADAAIAAMWPVMRELCAGVVETFIDGGGGPGDGIAELAAETIRNLEQPK